MGSRLRLLIDIKEYSEWLSQQPFYMELNKEDILDVLSQATDAVTEYGIYANKSIHLVHQLLNRKLSSEDILTANKSFNFLFNSIREEIRYFTTGERVEIIQVAFLRNSMIVTVKRKKSCTII
jgi:hypothetical protein